MAWIALGLWVFGSVCFVAGAWWATRPSEPPPSQWRPKLHAPADELGDAFGQPAPTGYGRSSFEDGSPAG